MKKALYAGSFDPITYGHKDVVQRSARHFDELTVGIGVNPAKEGKYTFSLQERLLLSRQTLADVINADVVAFR
jgi:pantetheine-phosphate adenylyltransferase